MENNSRDYQAIINKNDRNSVIRDYIDSDYLACENLVNNAWQFDKNFKPKEFADLSKYLYTMGSVSGSNFLKVVEVNNKVSGLLFGLNENACLPRPSVILGLVIIKRLMFIKGMSFKEKIRMLRAINTHETNKHKLVKRGKSEITLFVIDPAHQRIGYGQKLLAEFILQCKKSDVKSIIVETNKLGASGFYERVGFSHIGDFYSPLHEYVTKDRACMYEYHL